MTVYHEILAGVGAVGLGAVYALLSRSFQDPSSNSLLDMYDDGHLSEETVAYMEESASVADKLCPDLLKEAGGESKGYARWACRIAAEFKLEYGIPTRTVANRLWVREVLYKRLAKKNTRHRHMRCVLPLAIELVFLKDACELDLDRLMQQPEMVARAKASVKPYWSGAGWARAILGATLPGGIVRLLERAFPGTLSAVPGFGA